MRIKGSDLRKIIKEEISRANLLREEDDAGLGDNSSDAQHVSLPLTGASTWDPYAGRDPTSSRVNLKLPDIADLIEKEVKGRIEANEYKISTIIDENIGNYAGGSNANYRLNLDFSVEPDGTVSDSDCKFSTPTRPEIMKKLPNRIKAAEAAIDNFLLTFKFDSRLFQQNTDSIRITFDLTGNLNW